MLKSFGTTEMNLESKIIEEYLAEIPPGSIVMSSDVKRHFGLDNETAFSYMTYGLKIGMLSIKFRLPDQQWCDNLEEIPLTVATPIGICNITPEDVIVGFQRTNLKV